MQLGQEADQVLQAAAQPVHRPSHDHVEFPTRGITAQLVERRPLVASPGAADAMILVDPDDLAAHPTRDLAQLAFLIGRSLIDRTDPELDNRSAHSSILSVWPRKDAMRRTDNQSIFNTGNWDQNGALPWVFGKAFSRGFFVRDVAHSSLSRHTHCRPSRRTFRAPIERSARACLAIWIAVGLPPAWTISGRHHSAI